MQNRHLYEYAVIRVLPSVEREEFFNAGIILFSKNARYIRMRHHLNTDKLTLFNSQAESSEIINNLEAFEQIASGNVAAGPIACMDIASRFRWLTAVRSTIIQTSRPHPGICMNLDETFERLFKELVI